MTEGERAVERAYEDCAAIAEALAASVSRGVYRLQDFNRGEIAAAKHIARRIRESQIANRKSQIPGAA